MLYPAAAFAIAFVVTLGGTALLRRRLGAFVSREAKPGKERIHRLFPKPRKPLGGGVGMMAAFAAGTLVAAWLRGDPPRMIEAALVIVAGAWLFAAIGIGDDLRKARGAGMSERSKLLLQIAAGLALGLYLKLRVMGAGDVYVPLVRYTLHTGWLYVPFAALVIIATANGVNLADGVDGLAAGSVAIAGFAYFVIGSFWNPQVMVAAPALTGACLGFLVLNYPPARVLMGDTGALGLGAALAMMALLSMGEWALVLIGGVFVIDAMSVILQTGAIRLVRGPVQLLRHRTTEAWRPFLCTPLHHHFQWLGWREPRILALFWSVGLLLVLLGFADYALRVDWPWLVGLGVMAAFLAGAAWQKVARANFFLGLMPSQEGEDLLALFRGIPVRLLGRRLYQPCKVTPIPESAVESVAEENLWRPMGEVEAEIILGKVYCDHKLYDQAIGEWEQVPVRNLMLREDVVLRLARIYYARNRILDAVRLWERLPSARQDNGEGLGSVVARAKARLADLAGKSYRQAMRSGVRAELAQARRLNQDLLELLVYEREKLEAPGAGAQVPQATHERGLFRRMERAVLRRIGDLDQRLETPAPAVRAVPAAALDEQTEAVARRLGISTQELVEAFAACPYGVPRLRWCEAVAGASRNEIYRMEAEWAGPETMIAKRYDPARIQFFSACYRREAEVVRLLHQYAVSVPEFYGGVDNEKRAVGFFEDLGAVTLAGRLRENKREARARLLEEAVRAVARMHAVARRNLPRLREEILRIDKEALSERYYMDAFRIALERLVETAGAELSADERRIVEGQLSEVAATLATQPKTFIHFELTPHHLAVRGDDFVAFDFEQATLGPPEFDLVTLLRSPDSDLQDSEIERLLERYRLCMTESDPDPLPPRAPAAADYAALFKGLFYAGAAANFWRKFDDEAWLTRLRWYLKDWQAVAARYPGLAEVGHMLRSRFGRMPRASGQGNGTGGGAT
ncbi:MAG: phosphotransferase [Armatimonadota bacterium]|nr:MAG: phosphotransferase [Armatimonadota bacterium]